MDGHRKRHPEDLGAGQGHGAVPLQLPQGGAVEEQQAPPQEDHLPALRLQSLHRPLGGTSDHEGAAPLQEDALGRAIDGATIHGR
ncbi:MAG: hypothetical protein AMXMBFR64_25640 [Myxococcales bacterium]